MSNLIDFNTVSTSELIISFLNIIRDATTSAITTQQNDSTLQRERLNRFYLLLNQYLFVNNNAKHYAEQLAELLNAENNKFNIEKIRDLENIRVQLSQKTKALDILSSILRILNPDNLTQLGEKLTIVTADKNRSQLEKTINRSLSNKQATEILRPIINTLLTSATDTPVTRATSTNKRKRVAADSNPNLKKRSSVNPTDLTITTPKQASRPTRHDTVVVTDAVTDIIEKINTKIAQQRDRLAAANQKNDTDRLLALIDLNADSNSFINEINRHHAELNAAQQLIAKQLKTAPATKAKILHDLEARLSLANDDLRLLIIPFINQQINEQRSQMSSLLRQAVAIKEQLNAPNLDPNEQTRLKNTHLTTLDAAITVAKTMLKFMQGIKTNLDSGLSATSYLSGFIADTESTLQAHLDRIQTLYNKAKREQHAVQPTAKTAAPHTENNHVAATSLFHHDSYEVTGTAVHFEKVPVTADLHHRQIAAFDQTKSTILTTFSGRCTQPEPHKIEVTVYSDVADSTVHYDLQGLNFAKNFPAPDKCVATLLAADQRFSDKTAAIEVVAGPYLKKLDALANFIMAIVKDGYCISGIFQNAKDNTLLTSAQLLQLQQHLQGKLTAKEMARLPMLIDNEQLAMHE